jgi:hypothetical protein
MASAYLTRTTTNETATGRQKYTFSFWMKMANNNHTVFGASNDGTYNNNYNIFDINSVGRIDFSGYETGTTFRIRTTRNLRDYSGWYHIVVSVDTTQATASNRIKIYINGTQETDLDSSVYPSQNHQGRFFASSKVMTVGGRSGAYFNGSLAHFYAIEGVAYDADTFGETDSTTGIWKPKLNPSVTYANNSFFLKFENTSDFGEDSSGNNNDLTVNGTVTQTIDTPSNVFAVFNKGSWYDGTTGNGNTQIQTNQTNYRYIPTTFGVSKGKYYWEVKLQTLNSYSLNGITDQPSYPNTTNWILGSGAYDYSIYNGDGTVSGGNGHLYNNAGAGPGNTPGQFMGALSQGDILTFALDLDSSTKKLYIGANGQWANGSNATDQTFANATGKTIADPSSTNTGFYFPACGDYSGNNNSILQYNFGNGYFGTTAVSSAGTNAGVGTFEYDVPSGFKALCTKNINAEEYS